MLVIAVTLPSIYRGVATSNGVVKNDRLMKESSTGSGNPTMIRTISTELLLWPQSQL